MEEHCSKEQNQKVARPCMNEPREMQNTTTSMPAEQSPFIDEDHAVQQSLMPDMKMVCTSNEESCEMQVDQRSGIAFPPVRFPMTEAEQEILNERLSLVLPLDLNITEEAL